MVTFGEIVSMQDAARAKHRAGKACHRLERVRENARTNPKLRFTALLHNITPELLRVAYLSLRRKAAPGVDGVTWRFYGKDLDNKLIVAERHDSSRLV
jgi:RNA-directed DNA polymerase